ncbi:Cmr1p SCDLUD_000246 [Saccharomycodes ludwigii]|nr:hypothetical protein SCDLUD_000246 [Saccharomycodes ludwigii]KAH3902663.1 hypothetical protein SCDLUD_000246 [Saccharomycodes ludwigii]
MSQKLTDFQKKRLENIKRNNQLLQQLNLKSISSKIKIDEPKGKVPQKKKAQTLKKAASKNKSRHVKSPSKTQPIRRSKRLRGESADLNGVPNVSDTQLFTTLKSHGVPDADAAEELEDLKDTRVVGDVKISDLIKNEDGGDEQTLLAKFRNFQEKGSSGDFFEELSKAIPAKTPQIKQLRKDFDLDLYEIFQPTDIKICYDRVSALYFYPDTSSKLIIGGDISGHLGFWKVQESLVKDYAEEEPDITRFKLFNKNIGTIDSMPADLSKIIVSSYDSVIRTINLNNLKSEEILTLNDEYGNEMGISDMHFDYINPNVLFLSTLTGLFTRYDLRERKRETLYRLSDKKIGSFSINPERHHEIATGSLDRTLKIWDLRKIVKTPEWSKYEDYKSCDIISTYDSRLSVSAVSYSPTDQTLVCNGYDDTIRLFDVKKITGTDLEPRETIKHNCQSGRWTSILKARFKPNMNVFAIANMGRAIDLYTSNGDQLAHLQTRTVPAVISWHPYKNWIAGGNSSGQIFLFTDNGSAKPIEE